SPRKVQARSFKIRASPSKVRGCTLTFQGAPSKVQGCTFIFQGSSLKVQGCTSGLCCAPSLRRLPPWVFRAADLEWRLAAVVSPLEGKCCCGAEQLAASQWGFNGVRYGTGSLEASRERGQRALRVGSPCRGPATLARPRFAGRWPAPGGSALLSPAACTRSLPPRCRASLCLDNPTIP